MSRTGGRAASLAVLLCSQLPRAALSVSVYARSSGILADELKPHRAGEACRIPLTPTYMRTVSGCNGGPAYRTLRSGACRGTTWTMDDLPECMDGFDGVINITYKSDESERRFSNDTMQVLVDNAVQGTLKNTNCTSFCTAFVPWSAESELLVVQAHSGSERAEMHMSIENMYFVPGGVMPQPTPEVAAPPAEGIRSEAVPGSQVPEECDIPLTPSSLRTASGCNAKAMYKALRSGDCTSTKWTSKQIPACMSGLDGVISIIYTSDESDLRDTADYMQVLVDDSVSAKMNNTDCSPGCSAAVPWSARNERLAVQAQSSTGRGDVHMSIDKMRFIPAAVQPPRSEDSAPGPQEEQREEVKPESEEDEAPVEKKDEEDKAKTEAAARKARRETPKEVPVEKKEEEDQAKTEAAARKARREAPKEALVEKKEGVNETKKEAAARKARRETPKKVPVEKTEEDDHAKTEAAARKARSETPKKQNATSESNKTSDAVHQADSQDAAADAKRRMDTVVNDVSAKGDPHVTNVNGDRYDVQQHGPLTLLLLPRGAAKNRALLRVWALTKGTMCGAKYIDKLIVAGRWVEEKKHVGKTGQVENRWLYHTNEEWSNPESPNHRQYANLGPGVVLIVSHGKTDTGILYLNFRAHQLALAGVPIGGLLGDDDHSWAASQPETCAKSLSLMSQRDGSEGHSMSTLVATLY